MVRVRWLYSRAPLALMLRASGSGLPCFAANHYINLNLELLRQSALSNYAQPTKKTSQLDTYLRSVLVAKYIRKRAKGNCECCGKPAPFYDINGFGYLEVHHLLQLSEEGLDNAFNAAACCPNCHRELHYGANGADKNSRLREYIALKEEAIGKELTASKALEVNQ